MKKAYYEVVKTEEEKYSRIRELKEAHEGDVDFYSVYIDVDIRYNEAISKRRSFRSLMNAIRKKKVDTVFISSFEAFHISEMYALNILLRFKSKGIKIQIGTENEEISNSVLIMKFCGILFLKACWSSNVQDRQQKHFMFLEKNPMGCKNRL